MYIEKKKKAVSYKIIFNKIIMKIEYKSSLWQVDCEHWEYSDYGKKTIIVSANTIEEAINAVKVYYINNNNTGWLVFYNKMNKIIELYQINGESATNKETAFNWIFDTNYGDADRIYIYPLSVIYVWNEIAPKSLHTFNI